ncbi:MAG: hypothetical protein HKP30_09440 [Myxococcales bacterium]|nr:hypothetical protein [Myxococcales bacterium]
MSWDATRSPDALEVSCLLPGEAPAVSRVPALAASLALAAGSTVLAGPVVGGLVLLAAGGVVAATAAWRSGTDRDEALLDAFEQQPNRIGLEPLLG